MWHSCQLTKCDDQRSILQRSTDGGYDKNALMLADAPDDSGPLQPVGDPSGKKWLTSGQLCKKKKKDFTDCIFICPRAMSIGGDAIYDCLPTRFHKLNKTCAFSRPSNLSAVCVSNWICLLWGGRPRYDISAYSTQGDKLPLCSVQQDKEDNSQRFWRYRWVPLDLTCSRILVDCPFLLGEQMQFSSSG